MSFLIVGTPLIADSEQKTFAAIEANCIHVGGKDLGRV
jgi:hypothetical protein